MDGAIALHFEVGLKDFNVQAKSVSFSVKGKPRLPVDPPGERLRLLDVQSYFLGPTKNKALASRLGIRDAS
jgi:hypothetical protein